MLAIPAAAQSPEGYLDVYVTHVKMGKRAEFDEINKREVAMNRKDGDRWLAYDTVWGVDNTVYFVSTRSSFADAAIGINAFETAIKKGAGSEAGMRKLFSDFDATTDSQSGTLFRRRWDLSSAAPADMAASNKIIGQAHWLRVITTRVRPGKTLAYEAELRRTKEANDRMNSGVPFWVSQSTAGTSPGVYRTVNLLKSLAELDSIKTLQQVRGDSYASYMKTVEDAVERTEIIVGRMLPELSNPPEEVVAVDPAYWRPKAAPVQAKAAAPKAKDAAK
jgi:hypothetical protein